MLYANLVSPDILKNACFERDSLHSRDDGFEALVLLKERLRDVGVDLNTADIEPSCEPYFELHMNVQSPTSNATRYLLLLETGLIYPRNNRACFDEYRAVFTWNDDLVRDRGFIKINYPNKLVVPDVDGFASRNRFCCIIAGNKAAAVKDSRELYSERIKVIRWFEQNAPQDFDLYGTGWNLPPATPGLIGKVERRFWRCFSRLFSMNSFPSYRGRVDRKRKVLLKTRFSICYENVKEMPGYITEKLFDCFFAGCVPVYWGAHNIGEHIPSGCYIDRRQFANTEAVYEFMKAMDENTFRGYQQRIADFLMSEAVRPFGIEAFADTIVSTITQDLRISA